MVVRSRVVLLEVVWRKGLAMDVPVRCFGDGACASTCDWDAEAHAQEQTERCCRRGRAAFLLPLALHPAPWMVWTWVAAARVPPLRGRAVAGLGCGGSCPVADGAVPPEG